MHEYAYGARRPIDAAHTHLNTRQTRRHATHATHSPPEEVEAAEDGPLGRNVSAEPDHAIRPGRPILWRARWNEDEPARLLSPSGLAGPAQTYFFRTPEIRRPPQIQVGLSNPREPALSEGIWEEWSTWKGAE